MRLTKTLKTAFVNAVMADVPEVNYMDQLRTQAKNIMVEQLPDELKPIYEEYPAYFNNEGTYISHLGYLYGPRSKDSPPKFTETQLAELKALSSAQDAQATKRRELKTKLEGVIESVTTLKALKEALPEFEKYMPSEAVPLSRSVPALANVVAEFSRAGWPKNAKGTPIPVPKKATKPAAVIAL